MTRQWRSEIWRGRVQHQRLAPAVHRFDYALDLYAFDLDEIDDLLAQTAWCGSRRPALVRFREQDYYGQIDGDLAGRVRRRVAADTEVAVSGRVVLVTMLRQCGVSFNPVSFYLTHDETDTPTAVMAEITNTPWGERHQYVLPFQHPHGGCWTFDKSFHISPFNGMDQRYHWAISLDRKRVRIHMRNTEAGQIRFIATLLAQPRAANPASLWRSIIRQPFGAIEVLRRIYWQAGQLARKHVPAYDHPSAA